MKLSFSQKVQKTEKEMFTKSQLCHILDMPNQFYIHVEGVRDDC